MFGDVDDAGARTGELVASTGATLRYNLVGKGTRVLALHGAYSAHEEIRGFLDPALPDCQRLYPDLPGMGDSTAVGVDGSASAVTVLEELVQHEFGDEPFAVVAHSFGTHLARGLAARRPEQVRGLALICPYVAEDLRGEEHRVVADDGVAAGLLSDEELAEFHGYFVVRTEATVARFRAAVSPALGRYDAAAVERLMSRWRLTPDPAQSRYDGPVLIAAGRHDSFVGFRQQADLLAAYPGASSMVVADAGHALPHERPELLTCALRHWWAQVTAAAAKISSRSS